MATSYGISELDFRGNVERQHDAQFCFPLHDVEIVTDRSEHPAYAALLMRASEGGEQAGTVAWTASATRWIALAHEILRTFAPSDTFDQVGLISDQLGDLCALIEGLPDQLAGS